MEKQSSMILYETLCLGKFQFFFYISEVTNLNRTIVFKYIFMKICE